jgi:predicted DNA-binding protein
MSQKIYVPFKIEKTMLNLMIKKAELLGHTKSSYIRWLIEKDIKEDLTNQWKKSGFM